MCLAVMHGYDNASVRGAFLFGMSRGSKTDIDGDTPLLRKLDPGLLAGAYFE